MALLSGRKGHARVVLMPIIDAELEAVQQMFGATKEIGVSAVYTRPEFEFAVKDVPTPEKQYPFVVAQSAERSNAPAALSVREVLENYRPEVVVVVGIGGGIQRPEGDDASAVSGPKLGDVVIGRYVHYAEYTKNLPGGSYLRYISLDQPSSRLVSQHAQPLASAPSDVCFSRLVVRRPDRRTTVSPTIHISELVAVESIAGDPSAEKQIEMLDRFDNADVVDMESMGIGRALHDYRDDPHYSPLWLPVRGVSDLVTADNPPLPGTNKAGESLVGALFDDNNSQRKKWKNYACFAAACVARSLVERLLSEDRAESASDPGASKWLPDPDAVGG